MLRRCWPGATACLFIILLGFEIGRVIPQAHVLRFSDTLPTQDASQPTAFAVLPVSEPEAPAVSATRWLMHSGWKQIWPLRLLGAGAPLFFAGPSTQRYLRLSADNDYYIWTRQFYTLHSILLFWTRRTSEMATHHSNQQACLPYSKSFP